MPRCLYALDGGRSAAAVLRQFGAAEGDLDALLNYTDNPFDLSSPLVLEDEPSVRAWEGYLAESRTRGVVPVLRRVLLQLQFPVCEGMSARPEYRSAVRRGDTSGAPGEGLVFEDPDRIRLDLHPTPAGRLPVITVPNRVDFVSMVRALSRRNEPVPVPDTMGAVLLTGYNNWERVRAYRERWAEGETGYETWAEAFAAMAESRPLYQDAIAVLSVGPYSGVPAVAAGVGEESWRSLSSRIRLEHESAHYYCKRALGTMRANAHDEVLADAYALAVGAGGYRSDWMRAFLGVDGRGRLWNYRGGLSVRAFTSVVSLVESAIDRLAVELAGWEVDQPCRAAALVRHLAGRSLVEMAVSGRS